MIVIVVVIVIVIVVVIAIERTVVDYDYDHDYDHDHDHGSPLSVYCSFTCPGLFVLDSTSYQLSEVRFAEYNTPHVRQRLR